jgi:2-dehydropantoate 2-reductase
MRVVIVGPGALGSVLGAALSRAGHDVVLLGRSSPHLEAIRSDGLCLQRLDGTVERMALPACDDPAVVADADIAIILVKSGDTAAATRVIRRHVRDGQTVLTLQNGMGNAERIRAELGHGPRILAGVTSQAAMRTGPGTVVHTGAGPTIIGAPNGENAQAAAEVAAMFSAADLPAVAVPDIERWIWQKVAVNAAINGLTALGGFANGAIVAAPDLLDAAEVIAEEAAAVARAHGFELGGMRRAVTETAMATAANRSSMLQDLEAGRPTEVDAIHGSILAAGEEAGIATPATAVVAALIRTKERTGSGMETERNNG